MKPIERTLVVELNRTSEWFCLRCHIQICPIQSLIRQIYLQESTYIQEKGNGKNNNNNNTNNTTTTTPFLTNTENCFGALFIE
jgi:hypothetical protein